MKKVVFIDVDGTIINDLKEITLRTIEAIRTVRKKGYEIVLCTGRPLNYAEKLNNCIESIYIIYNNGEKIVVQVKNNSKDTIEFISVRVVYYKGDKVIGIDDGTAAYVKSGRFANFNLDYPYDKNYNDIKFDSYKLFMTGAYSYKE